MSQEHYARIAGVYDAFVKTAYDVPFFLEEARRHGGKILELMAGTGRLTLPVTQAGFPVTALDFSAEMLDILRHKVDQLNLPVSIEQADVRTFDLGRQFEQIWIPFQAFPELTDEADQRQALERIYAHLADDGVFICTLHNPVVRRRSIDGQMRLAGDHLLDSGRRLMVWLLQVGEVGTGVVDVHEFFEEYDAQGVMVSKRASTLRFHLLEKAAFERLFLQAGFQALECYGIYERSAFDEESSPFMIWLLRRQR